MCRYMLEHVRDLEKEIYSSMEYVTIHMPFYLEMDIYATCSTFITVEGKGKLTNFFPFNHAQCLSLFRLL